MKSDEANTLTKPAQRKKLVEAFAILTVLVVLAVVVALLLGVTWQKILTVTIFSAVIFGLGVLNALNERFRREQWIEKALAAYFRFCVWMMVAFFPATIIIWLNRLILQQLALNFQIIVFVAWGAALAWAIWLVSTYKKRARLFNWLQARVGRFTPLAYSFNLLMIAMIFFSSVTYVLSAHGKLHLIGVAGSDVSSEAIQDFYLWHFLEAVPLLKVNETLRWKAPLSYDSGFVGLVLLLFKLAVIVPVIACFASYWKQLGASDPCPPKPESGGTKAA